MKSVMMATLRKLKLLSVLMVLIITAITTGFASSARISTKHAAGSQNHHGTIVTSSTVRISGSTNTNDSVPSVVTGGPKNASTNSTTSRLPLFPRDWVMINNHVGGPISFDCASHDDDMGMHSLDDDTDYYYFAFTPNLWGTTLFWCNFIMGGDAATFRQAHVVVYPGGGYIGRQPYVCTHCVWDVRVDGFYRSDSRNPYYLVQQWDAPPAKPAQIDGTAPTPRPAA